MASVISNTIAGGAKLFPAELTTELFNLVRGKSALARLSGQMPLAMRGTQAFTFNFDKEVDLVAENGAKGNGGGVIAPITVVPVKVEYGMRISDEFKYAAEETQLEYLRAFAEGFANKAARGLDIMAFHGVNPRTGTASAVIGTNHFDSKITQKVQRTTDANADMEAAIALVNGNEHEVTGAAVAPTFKSALAAQKSGDNYLFPELGWGNAPETVRGLSFDTNSTVSFGNTSSAGDLVFVGNFRDYFRYGIAKDVTIELIEYGNPDNDATAGDLKGHNQVYLRGEMYIGWGILAPEAFAKVQIEAIS